MTLCSIFVGGDTTKIDQTLTSPAWLSHSERGVWEGGRRKREGWERERERYACTESAELNYTFDIISTRAHKACP